uniref:CRAL-TRIO domain-containing protein n=1 Tax=Compsopogon caeruleus TaxID=31354 RepID=A0A6T6CE09_9RHOD
MDTTDDELVMCERLRLRLESEPRMNDVNWKFCNEDTLVRYLRAWSHNEEKALQMLQRTLEWRDQVKHETVVCRSCLDDGASHSMRGVGIDLMGRPVFYSQFALIRNGESESNTEHLIFKLENVFKSENVRHHSYVWIIDFAGFSRKDVSLSFAKHALKMFQDHYPERLGVAVLLDPQLFSILYGS